MREANERRKKLGYQQELTPLEFMLNVLRAPGDYPFAARQWAAKEAAPYVHKRMPIAIEGGEVPIRLMNLSKLSLMSELELNRLLKNLDSVLQTLGVVVGGEGDRGEPG